MASGPTLLIPRVQPSLAYSDRVILPQSVLERLLDYSGKDPLPSPLTFRLANSATNVYTHCGVREFSAPDGIIYISQQIAISLGLSAKQLTEAATALDSGQPWDVDSPPPSVTVSRHDLPKGTSVSLRPLDNDYLSVDDDWKALLESSLQSSYTTLTDGQVLSISHPATHSTMSFIVDKLQPERAVCIVETDLSVDFEAMSEDHARRSVAKRDAKRESENMRSVEIIVDAAEPVKGAFVDVEALRVPFFFELKSWDRELPLIFKLESSKIGEESADLDDRSADLYISIDDNSRPSSRYYLWSTITDEENSITISSSNSFISSAQVLHLAVTSCAVPLQFSLTVTQTLGNEDEDNEMPSAPAIDAKECSNCHQFFPPRTFQLHTAFCERNNILCPNPSCSRIFRRQEGIPETHWHCDSCPAFICDAASTKEKHISGHHTPCTCICGESFGNSLNLTYHRTTTCPQKLHICRFCHLRLPQEDAPDSQSDLLAGYTGHESRCGTRTTECPRCGRNVRLRDVDSHMRLHEIQRVAAPMPAVCSNPLCVRVTEGDHVTVTSNNVGLCPSCYGPLYSPMHDPTGARLKSRIERRYFIQLSTGCKKSLCENIHCASGRANLGLPKYTSAEISSIVRELVQGGKLQFCVDDSMTRRRKLVDWIAEDKEFARPWICKAVGEVGVTEGEERESEIAARAWLVTNGVRVSEVQ
ncbi:ubiquitin fusion degradation protein UFD1-domain-containing protein [Kockiozyma suomiensis]|uniref:ubiquitin fusion degradation protein UFD1-domain-containing protein n=1 Tax=Kockiozyma suomiensis TaxID=1337062 RepID=UPI0033443007